MKKLIDVESLQNALASADAAANAEPAKNKPWRKRAVIVSTVIILGWMAYSAMLGRHVANQIRDAYGQAMTSAHSDVQRQAIDSYLNCVRSVINSKGAYAIASSRTEKAAMLADCQTQAINNTIKHGGVAEDATTAILPVKDAIANAIRI